MFPLVDKENTALGTTVLAEEVMEEAQRASLAEYQ